MLTLFIFYEVLTLSTYPLVTHHRTAEAMRGGRMAAAGGGSGYRAPNSGNGMVSGLNPDDYDIPTFFRNAD